LQRIEITLLPGKVRSNALKRLQKVVVNPFQRVSNLQQGISMPDNTPRQLNVMLPESQRARRI